MTLASSRLRRKAQPFIMLEELWSILELGVGTAPEIAWMIEPSGQITGLVPDVGGELEIRYAFHAWAELVGARRLGEVVVGGVTNLKAVADAYGPRLIRVVVVAEIWPEGAALRAMA